MQKAHVIIGGTYVAMVSRKLTQVRILSANNDGGWNAINIATNRPVRIRTAAGLREEIEIDRLAAMRELRAAGISFEKARAMIDARERALRDAAARLMAKG